MLRGTEQSFATCTTALQAYAEELRQLRHSLDAGRWYDTWWSMQRAKAALSCSQCLRQERYDAPRVLSLIMNVEASWENWAHPSYAALARAPGQRLSSPTFEAEDCPMTRLRFTHATHGECVRYGVHASWQTTI